MQPNKPLPIEVGRLIACVSCCALLFGACSSHEDAASSATNAPEQDAAFGPYEIKFFTGLGADTAALAARPDPTLWHGSGASTRPMSLQTEEVRAASGAVSSSILIRAALLECGLSTGSLTAEEFEDASSFFYQRGLLNGPDCDRLLASQQLLTCAADKLAELGEAVGPVVWENDRVSTGMPPGPYTFPPQDAHARFIARDAALRVLAHVSWLDMLPVANSATGSTCTDLYSRAVHGPSLSDVPRLFGISAEEKPAKSLPPLSPARPVSTTADVAELAQGRLEYKAHLLRAAARMIPDLVQDSVYADLAGGARKSAVAGDFSRGQQALWGNAADG